MSTGKHTCCAMTASKLPVLPAVEVSLSVQLLQRGGGLAGKLRSSMVKSATCAIPATCARAMQVFSWALGSLGNPLHIMPCCCAAGMLSYWPSFGPLSQLGSPLDRTRSSSLSGSSQPSRQPSMLPVSPTQAQLNSIVMGASKLPAGASPASTPGEKSLLCVYLCNASQVFSLH